MAVWPCDHGRSWWTIISLVSWPWWVDHDGLTMMGWPWWVDHGQTMKHGQLFDEVNLHFRNKNQQGNLPFIEFLMINSFGTRCALMCMPITFVWRDEKFCAWELPWPYPKMCALERIFLLVNLTHSVRDAHLCARSPLPPFDEMRIYAHRNCHDCTPRCAFERIFLLVNLNENCWTIG